MSKAKFPRPSAVALALREQELEDLRSATSFTVDNYTRLTRDKAPNFKAALERLDSKIKKKLRELRGE